MTALSKATAGREGERGQREAETGRGVVWFVLRFNSSIRSSSGCVGGGKGGEGEEGNKVVG